MPRKPSNERGAKPRAKKHPSSSLLTSQILEMVPDATIIVDQSGTIIAANQQTTILFGYKSEELLGQKIELLIPERHLAAHERHRAEYVSQPRIRQMGAGLELFARRKDRSEFAVEISLSPVRTAEGMVVLSALRDISARKEVEQELRRAHAELGERSNRQIYEYRSRLASIIDSSEDAIIGKTLEGIITSWNRGAEHIYGYTEQEMIGKSVSLLTPPDRPDEIPEILRRIKQGETVSHLESIRVTKDGRYLNISLTVSPIRDEAGTIIGASAIGRDVTAQKRAEDQLRQSQKMEAIGRLAGGVAHDFNNILGIITACTELLRARFNADGSSQYVDNIRKAAERGATLTRQLLAFSRQQVVQTTILDLNERLKETGKLLRPLMGDDVEVAIVPQSKSALVEADPMQLDQVVLNLAVNARDAMPKGGKLILQTSTVIFDDLLASQHAPLKPGRYVTLSVSDTGTGMDQATAARIFEPFFTTKEVGKGTGLGLSMVYGIVRQSNGHILVYSEPGRGTTFKVYLPSAEEKLNAASGVEQERIPERRTGMTVLLVEDDEIMRLLTKEMLEEHGYKVIEAADGKIALDQVSGNKQKIDVLLTDVVMRNVSGPELVRQLGASHPEMAVVYMSGYTGELLGEREVFQSGTRLLEKPFTRATLLNKIEAAIREHS